MNESETRAEHIDPALKVAGWGVIEGSKILREYPITMLWTKPEEIRQKGRVPKNNSIFFTIFQTFMDGPLIDRQYSEL